MTDPTALPNLPGFGGAPSPSDGGDEAPPETPLKDRLVEALTALELKPTLDEDGDITFVFQEQQLFIRASDEDAQILRLFGQWRLADPVPTDPMERLTACNDVNIAFNMIKTAMAEDTLLVTSEHMVPRGADVRSLLMVAIPLVLHGVGLWHQRAIGEEKMQQISGNDGAPAPGGEPGPGAAFGLNGNQQG